MAGKHKSSLAIGIDLGTTYSRVGVWQDDHVGIIADDQGNRATPSVVAFTDPALTYVTFPDNGRLIGDAAKKLAPMDPRNAVYDTRRLIGRRFSDTCVQSDMKLWPFKVTPGPNEKPMIVVDYKGEEKQFSAEEISAMVLTKLKKTAEAFLESTVKNVVITVPAYFTTSQRNATEEACIISGFKTVRIINEPTAAAIAYGLDKNATSEKNVLVFDLGGATFDASLLMIEEGVIEVKSIAGDSHLGGDDFDNRMVNHFIREFERKHHKDISMSARSLRRLKVHCEKAKRKLSFDAETTIEIESLYEGIDFYCTITRDEFEELNIDLFQKCISNVEKCLSNVNMEKGDVHEVVLVGGLSWIPKVQQLLQDFFNGKDLCKSINPDEVVTYGAAVQAGFLTFEGNQKFQDKLVEDFCNRIIEDHEKLEAMSAFEIYIYHMRNTVKKLQDAIYDPNSWLQAYRSFPKADDFKNKKKYFEKHVNEIYQENVTGWSMDELDKKKLEAKKKLEKYIHTMGDMMKDKRFKYSFDVTDKKKIKDAIGEVTLWLHEHPFGKRDKFEYKLENLERICNPILLKMQETGALPIDWRMKEDHEMNLEVKKEFENYLYNMRNTTKDEKFGTKFSLRDKNKIEDAIDEAFAWLDANQEAYDFDDKLNEIESVCNPIIVKMYQGGAFAESWWMEKEYMKNLEAKNALENYTYNMENSVKDEKIWEKLGGNNKEKIEDAVDETIGWLDANQVAEADEFEYKLKELKSICEDS